MTGGATGIFTVDVPVTFTPPGPVPVAVPVLSTVLRFMSALVVVRVAVQVSDLPAASDFLGQRIWDRPFIGSVTTTGLSVVCPVLVTL